LEALETMLYTIDYVNENMAKRGQWIKGVRLGTHILDDCDKDTYGLEQAVDFIKGTVKMHQSDVISFMNKEADRSPTMVVYSHPSISRDADADRFLNVLSCH